MAFRGRKNPLHIFGPIGTSQIMNCIKNLGYFNLSFPIHTYELDSGLVIETEDYRVFCCPTMHTVPNLAYSIEEKRSPKFILDKAIALGVKPGPDFGKLQAGIPVNLNGEIVMPEQVLGDERKGRLIVYSGDTRPCSNMINFSHGADVLIHESTFDDGHQDKALENGHSTASEASQIAKSAQVQKLILTHISTRYRDTDLLKKQALKIFENSMLAEDLMRIKVK